MKTYLIALAALLVAFSAAHAEPSRYSEPAAAVDAVIKALTDRDRDALLKVFGDESEDLVFTGNEAEDLEIWRNFMQSYKAAHRIAVSSDGATATLYIGRDQWPFPVRLTKQADGKWAFDPEAARDEILERRIGGNELDVIDALHQYVRVQRRFRETDYDNDGVLEFASSVLSSEGKQDGLYWPPGDDVPESPIGDFMARASADGFSIGDSAEEPEPYLGYYFRVLQKQGENTPGGALDYIINGNMVAGHALLAFPSDYGQTGVMTFMVGENGVVYEADLGPETLNVANAIAEFDPGPDWVPVE
jgi:hypothetical protein